MIAMPTYEFLCSACKEKFELFLPMSSRLVQPCPKCGRQSKRLISGGGGLIFKGSGFYITDYRSSDYKAKASADKPGGAPAPSNDGGGSKDAAKPTPANGGGDSKDTAKPAPAAPAASKKDGSPAPKKGAK
jgi:putative FmdB family regulatory protein